MSITQDTASKLTQAGVTQLVSQFDQLGAALETALVEAHGAITDTGMTALQLGSDASKEAIEDLAKLRQDYTQRAERILQSIVKAVPGL